MPVDYAKLAQQHGGRSVDTSATAPVDIAALAASHGGVSEPASAPQMSRRDTQPPSSSEAISAALMKHLVPYVQRGIEDFATNPNVPKITAKVGRVIGGAAPIVGGGMELGPGGAILGVGSAAKGAWAGGKTGWFTGKLLQNVSAHVANLANEVAPYLEKLNPAIGAQGVLDLAQMAEPDRADIGVLGVGHAMSDDDLMRGLMTTRNMSARDAAEAVSKGDPKKRVILLAKFTKAEQ